MLIYRRTSVLESTAQTLVNTVNCVGIMGKGIAKAFKDLEPEMFAAYKVICDRNLLEPGKLWLWQGAERWVLNFPTKIHWRNPSKIEWIEAGLQKFVSEYAKRGIKEISFPRLGCGNGGLDWAEVKPLMERYLSDIEIPVYIHDHTVDIGIPEHLEGFVRDLRDQKIHVSSFDAFLRMLKTTADVAGESLIELESRRPFTAKMDQDHNLTITTPIASLMLEAEDLRGVWVSLLTGLVTREKAGWTVTDGGEALLSMISLLPDVRPIEIQRACAQPELAVELITDAARSSPVPLSGDQSAFAWA
jgi:O-acetyl-ADP-ribose deacetylase (regulator of RNase III)